MYKGPFLRVDECSSNSYNGRNFFPFIFSGKVLTGSNNKRMAFILENAHMNAPRCMSCF